MKLTARMALTAAVIACFNPLGSADEPSFGFLRLAQHWYGNEGMDIQLVQAEQSAPEITQPTDFGSSGSSFTGLQTGSDEDLGDLNLGSLFAPELPSASSSSLNTPAQVEKIESVTGQSVDTGLVQTAPVEVLQASTFNLINVPDVAETIVDVATTPTVKARRRSPLALEARIRGYQGQQI